MFRNLYLLGENFIVKPGMNEQNMSSIVTLDTLIKLKKFFFSNLCTKSELLRRMADFIREKITLELGVVESCLIQ